MGVYLLKVKPINKQMNYKQYQLNQTLASAIVDELNDWSMHDDAHSEAVERENNSERLLQKMRMKQCEEVIKLLSQELLNNIDDVE
jgi:hypothetical protein